MGMTATRFKRKGDADIAERLADLRQSSRAFASSVEAAVSDLYQQLEKMQRPENLLLPRAQAAEMLGISDRTLKRWIEAGRVKAIGEGKGVRVAMSEVKRLEEEAAA